MEDALLIEQVRKFSSLYDKVHKDFKNKQKRRNAWETIAAVCEDSVDNKRWVILRNRYASEKRKLRCVPSGSAATATPVRRYFDSMQFLDKHDKARKTSGNYARTDGSQETEIDMPSDVWNSINVIAELSDDEASSHSPTPVATVTKVQIHNPPISHSQNPGTSTAVHKPIVSDSSTGKSQSSSGSGSSLQTPVRRKKTDGVHEIINKSFERVEKLLNTVSSSSEDEDDIFAKSIIKTLKRQKNRKTKANIKVKIWSILAEYEQDSDNE